MINGRSTRRFRRGYSLMELLIALGLIMIVMNSAGDLYRAVVNSGRDQGNLSNRASRIDTAVNVMRRDAWGCSRIAVTDGKSAQLSLPDGDVLTWRIDADGNLSRTNAAGAHQEWSDIGRDWTFARDGVALTISNGDYHGITAIRMTSQMLLAEGVR